MPDRILRIPLLPVLAVQALRVRARAMRLPEPDGHRAGRAGVGPHLRLLIAGDSSAAGVGAPTQDDALAGQLVKELGQDFTVDWRLEATTGHTTRDTLNRLRDLDQHFDVALVALGVNDTTRGVSAARFARNQRELMTVLTGRLGARFVLSTAVPPMQHFPALPQPLAWALGAQAARLDHGLRQVASGFDAVHHHVPPLPQDPGFAARDGYHPNPAAYAIWAGSAATLIRDAWRGS